MLGLEPELESRLQQAWPKAITLFNGMRAGLFYRLPQEELTEEDYQLLTDDEKNELRCIGKRVVELMSRDKKSFWRSYDDRKFPVADKAIIKKYHDDISILLLQKDLQVQMDKLSLLLEKVCRLKTARAKEEKRKLEEQAEAARIQKERADETAREIAREITRKEKERADEVAKEERRNQAEKTALAEILFNREIRKGLPKDAAKRFADFRLEVLEEITPFTTDEKFSYVEFDMLLNTYLNDVDKAQVGKNKQNIWEWLHICKTSGEGYSRVISDDMSELKKLIVKAFQARMEEKRKLEEQAEAARIQKERAEAFKHVYPDQLKIEAKRYLEKDEQEKLLKAACEAIDGYLKEGKSYLNSYKSPFDYHWLTNKINNKKNEELREINYKKEQEQIRNDAQAQAQAFRSRLDQGLKEIERKLSPKKKDPTEIFKKWCSNNGEKRYLGESFADILASGDKSGKWTQNHIAAAEAELQEKFIPEEFSDFILKEPKAIYFLLPTANFADYGVPCLDFYFDVFAVVTITVSAQAGKKEFNKIQFNFLREFLEPELLGFYHMLIYPSKAHFWQSVPISLFHALIDGKAHAPGPGITPKVRNNLLTEYQVKKFEHEKCTIPISFEQYCRIPGIIEKMREVGTIDERTAEMLELPQPISINHKESKGKKAKAFLLFSRGKRPSDPEVKTLGIKPTSAYRYYQQWKKVIIVGNNRI